MPGITSFLDAFDPAAPAPAPKPAESTLFKMLDDPAGGLVQRGAELGRPWEETRSAVEKSFPGVNPDAYRTPFLTETARQKYAGGEEQGWQYAAQAVPGFSTGLGMGQDLRYARAKEKIAKGEGKESDFNDVASYERMKHIQTTESTPDALLRAAVKLPAVLGEVAAAGPALEGAAAIPRVGLGAKYLAMPALVPSLGAYEGATANVAEKGGDALSPKNVAPAYGLAVLNGIVLGQLQGAGPVGKVPTAAGRALAKGGLGVAEQAGADLFASAVDETLPDAYKTKTKYGLVGDLAKAARGEPGAADAAMKHAAVQMFTFTAFAAAHGRDHAAVPEKFKAVADTLHDAGVPAEVADSVLADAVERVLKAPDKATAQAALDKLPDGPLKDYVTTAALPTVPERRGEDAGPPEGTADRRAKPVVNLETVRDGKTMDGRPELRLKVTDADGKHVADAVVHPTGDKTRGDEGDVHVDFVGRPGSSPTDAAGGIGESLNRAIQEKIAAAFPDATHVTGYRQSGARSPENLVKNNPELADLSPDDRQRAIRSLQFTRVKIPGREPSAERPPVAPPEPVTVTDSPQPPEPQRPEPQRPPLKIADLTLGQTKVAALATGLPHLGPTDALKRSLVKALGENLPERLRAAVEGTPPVAIKPLLPEAGPDGLPRPGEPGLGAPAGQPGSPLVENVHPAVARARLRQAKLVEHGLVPKPQPGPDVGQGQGLARFNEPATVPKLSPKQHRGRAWVKLELAGQQAEALRERAGGVVGDQLGRAGDRPPELPDRADPNAWKMRVLRDRLLSGRQLIADATKDPTPEKVTAARGAVESIRRASEANGERGRSLRDKAYPDWSEVEKRFAEAPPASEFGLRPLKPGEPVTVTGKPKAAPSPEGAARRLANLKQNREGRSFVRQLQLDGGIDPDKFVAFYGQGEYDRVIEGLRTPDGRIRKKGNPFVTAAGGRGTRHPEDVLPGLARDGIVRTEFGQHTGEAGAPDAGHFLELIHANPRMGDLGGKAAATELAKKDEARFQAAEDEERDRLRKEGFSEAEIAETLRLAGEEADRQINARWAAEQAAERGQGAAAPGALGRDQLRAAGGGAGREPGGRPQVPDAAAEAADAHAEAADGGLDLSWDVGKLDAESAADRLLSEQVRSNQERAAELPLPEAMGAASAGFTAKLGKDVAAQVKEAAARLVHRVQDFADRMAGGGMTRTARLSQAAANAGEEFAGKRIHAQELAPHLLDKVMPGSGSMADRLLFMSTFAEERLRHMRELNRREAMAASAEGVKALRAGDREKAAEWFKKADAASKAMRKVISLVGKTFADPTIPYPLPDEAAYQRAVADPKYRERMARHVKEVVPVMEEAFRKAEGMAETDPIHGPTQLPGRPVSLIGKKPGEETPTTVVLAGTGRGNLIGHRLRKLGAAQLATGAAEHGYELDYGHVLERMLSDRLPLAAKAEVYRTYQAEGVGVWRKPGETYEPHGLPWRKLPDVKPPRGTQAAARGETDFWVHPDAYGETRQLFGTDEPLPRTPLAGALTVASIASGAEFLPHARNLISFMTRPEMHFSDVYRGVRGELTKDPQFRQEILELARIAALKERGFENASFKSKWNPLTYVSRALDVVDRAMRFAAAKAYDRMAEAGHAEKSDRGKRQFVNQLGNYSKLTQNRLVAMLRDTGFGPFATAASNWWMQSLRGNLLQHGFRTTSRSADMRLRAEMLLRMAVVPAAVAAVNYAFWGRVDGDDDTPIGSLKLGKHNGRTAHLDLTSLTGVTRGLRETGLLALAENKRPGAKARGATTGDAVDAAVRDIVTGVTHPAMGPPAAFAETALTGKNTLGTPVAPKAAPGESKSLLDLYAAVWQANPALESWLRPLVDPRLGFKPVKREESLAERGLKLLGPYGPKFSGGPPGQPHRTEETPRPTQEQRLLRPGK